MNGIIWPTSSPLSDYVQLCTGTSLGRKTVLCSSEVGLSSEMAEIPLSKVKICITHQHRHRPILWGGHTASNTEQTMRVTPTSCTWSRAGTPAACGRICPTVLHRAGPRSKTPGTKQTWWDWTELILHKPNPTESKMGNYMVMYLYTTHIT